MIVIINKGIFFLLEKTKHSADVQWLGTAFLIPIDLVGYLAYVAAYVCVNNQELIRRVLGLTSLTVIDEQFLSTQPGT